MGSLEVVGIVSFVEHVLDQTGSDFHGYGLDFEGSSETRAEVTSLVFRGHHRHDNAHLVSVLGDLANDLGDALGLFLWLSRFLSFFVCGLRGEHLGHGFDHRKVALHIFTQLGLGAAVVLEIFFLCEEDSGLGALHELCGDCGVCD